MFNCLLMLLKNINKRLSLNYLCTEMSFLIETIKIKEKYTENPSYF